MAKLAVLILTFNEELHIEECMNSAAFADEIVVIDSGSTDRTVEMAENAGAKVAVRPMADGFAAQRNFALTQTDAEWVLFLDADERITEELAKEITSVVAQNEPVAYELLRYNFIFRQPMNHGVFRPDYSLRLYPRTAISWTGLVHEKAHVSCPVHRLKSKMLHYTYDDWERYFSKFNNYTTIMARKMYEEGKTASLAKLLFRPLWAFFRVYILQNGWRDGKLGLIFSINHFFYTFVKYAKLDYLYLKNGKPPR